MVNYARKITKSTTKNSIIVFIVYEINSIDWMSKLMAAKKINDNLQHTKAINHLNLMEILSNYP